MLKKKQRFQSARHNFFTEEINKAALSWNNDKKVESIDLTEPHVYGMSKDLVREKEKVKCNNIIKWYKNY